MKTKWKRLPKGLRLAFLLVLIGLMLLCLWMEDNTRHLSPRGALREIERRCLLEPGTFLTHRFDFPERGFGTDYFVAVSRTDTRLHAAELWRDGLWWEGNARPMTVPLEEPVTAVLLPWQVNIEDNLDCYPAAVVYCTDPAATQVTGTLTIDGVTFSGRAEKGGDSCWLVVFEDLYELEDPHYHYVISHLFGYYHQFLPLGSSIQVDLTVYDQTGRVFAEKTLSLS